MKLVAFELSSGAAAADIAAHPDHIESLEAGVAELTEGMFTVVSEVKSMRTRGKTHRKISEATYERLRNLSLLEAFLLVAVSVGQIYYLRRFFEVKRIV